MILKNTDALILAGGFGTRLRSVVYDLPKPMAPVNGRPFLWYLLSYLYQQGIRRTFFSLHYMYEAIQHYFGDYFYDMELGYFVEDDPKGTGGAILFCLNKMDTKNDIFIINGDTYSSCSLYEMCEHHSNAVSQKNLLSIAITHVVNSDRYHGVTVENGRVTDFYASESGQDHWINSGIYLASSGIRDALCLLGEEKFSFENDFLAKFCKHYFFSAFPFYGNFIDIGVVEDYEHFLKKHAPAH